MNMNIHELLKTYIGMWPSHVRIDDGYSTGSGFMFPTLSQVHRSIEDVIDHENDHWGNLFTWSMFQACQKRARHLFARGSVEMAIAEVPPDVIDQCVVGNLSDDEWAEERSLYAALGSNNALRADGSSGEPRP